MNIDNVAKKLMLLGDDILTQTETGLMSASPSTSKITCYTIVNNELLHKEYESAAVHGSYIIASEEDSEDILDRNFVIKVKLRGEHLVSIVLDRLVLTSLNYSCGSRLIDIENCENVIPDTCISVLGYKNNTGLITVSKLSNDIVRIEKLSIGSKEARIKRNLIRQVNSPLLIRVGTEKIIIETGNALRVHSMEGQLKLVVKEGNVQTVKSEYIIYDKYGNQVDNIKVAPRLF